MSEPEMDGAAPTAVVDSLVADHGQPSDGVLRRVRSLLPEFTGALRRVAEQVLTDPAAASRATIVELAERSGTSPATVTRFCRALGFDGYADLRLGIAAETGRARLAGWTVDIGREIQPNDPLERVLGQIMAADTRAMHDTAALLDLAEVERAAVAIAAAPRVNIFGRQRKRAGRRGDAVQPVPDRRCTCRQMCPCWSSQHPKPILVRPASVS
jgi:hypothetical protein